MPNRERRLLTTGDLRRAGVEQEQLQQLGRMADMLEEVETYTVDASSLEPEYCAWPASRCR